MYDMQGPLYTIEHKKHGVYKGKYIFSINDYYYDRMVTATYLDLRKHFDPHNNRRIGFNNMWKFNTKEEVEELIMLAKLKGLM